MYIIFSCCSNGEIQNKHNRQPRNPSDGRTVNFHNDKERMGKTEKPEIFLNLDDLIRRQENLEDLSAPVTTEEIDCVVKDMPNDSDEDSLQLHGS